MIPTKNLADLYLATDGRPIGQSHLFQGYDQLGSAFKNRDPRMSMTFIVPGSEFFADGGKWRQPIRVSLVPMQARTGYMIRKFLGGTIEATQSQGYYDFKEFRYAEVLLILAEALYERNGQISDADLGRTINLRADAMARSRFSDFGIFRSSQPAGMIIYPIKVWN